MILDRNIKQSWNFADFKLSVFDIDTVLVFKSQYSPQAERP
jgi:hypothetical protein